MRKSPTNVVEEDYTVMPAPGETDSIACEKCEAVAGYEDIAKQNHEPGQI